MTLLNERQQKRIYDLAFAAGFVLAIIFMLWKAPYGFHFSDEAYYLTVPYRMAQGDRLFRDMWDISQFSMLPTVPIMRIYLKLFGTTESMVLHFRYIYIFFHAAFSLWLYIILRRSFPMGAMLAAAVYMLFSPINIMQFSYNSYGIGFMAVSGALMAENRKTVLAGVLYALAVLSCPFAAVLFFVFTASASIRRTKEKSARWRSFTLGVAASALVFLVYVQLTVGFGEMIKALPEFFKDPTHPVNGFPKRIMELFKTLLTSKIPVTVALGVQLAAIAAYLAGGKKKSMRWWLCVIASAAAVIGMLYEMKTDRWINCLMVPITYLGLTAYVLSERRSRAEMSFLYIPGLLYSVCTYMASDLGYMTMSGAMTVSALASVYFIARLASEMLEQDVRAPRFPSGEGREAALYNSSIAPKRKAGMGGWTGFGILALILVLLCQLGAQVWYRKNFCFSELYSTPMMYETVEKGSGKGEKTSLEAIEYEFRQVWDSSEKVREHEGDYVLYFSKDSWLYLEDKKRCSGQSSWIQMGHTVEEADRLIDFWEEHPEKKPDAIYVSAETENAEKVIEIINTEHFPIDKNDRGYEMVRPK